jgi:hypothetical protein
MIQRQAISTAAAGPAVPVAIYIPSLKTLPSRFYSSCRSQWYDSPFKGSSCLFWNIAQNHCFVHFTVIASLTFTKYKERQHTMFSTKLLSRYILILMKMKIKGQIRFSQGPATLDYKISFHFSCAFEIPRQPVLNIDHYCTLFL